MPKPKKTVETKHFTISPPNIQELSVKIIGTSPYVQHAFSEEDRTKIKKAQEEGKTAKSKKNREPKDFNKQYENGIHYSREGWMGIPAPAFRKAMISACRLVNFKMTLAKLSFTVKADGYDKNDNQPLVKIIKGKPHYSEHHVRLETGVIDIRSRPMWDEGWEAILHIRYDADQFTADDILNLLMRVGSQVGIGEGRSDSPKSCGCDWGYFRLSDKGE